MVRNCWLAVTLIVVLGGGSGPAQGREEPSPAPARAKRGCRGAVIRPLLHGLVYAVLGQYDRAIADCTAALRLDPDSTTAYSVRGWAYTQSGDHQQALADCNEVLQRNPKSAAAH